MTKRAKIIITISMMLGMSLASLDITIVGTALPSIVGKLGGITLYSWVFSTYLLASTTTVPIYGKLADLYGRKPIFLLGSGLFILGSIACGMSQTMVQLIIFRTIQGLGAGAVLPLVLTIIGDIFALEERARVQGLFSGIWGLSSLVGPALGGLIVDHFSWRWVFYINVPFGLLSMILLMISFKEQVERKKQHLDYIGTFALTTSVTALLFAVLQGGTTWAWDSLPSFALFAAAIVFLVIFLWQEQRTPDPILPLSLFKSRIITISSIGSLVLGIVMFGITSFIPLFVQGVQGGTATNAGLSLMPFLLAWPIAATFSGKMVIRYGYRLCACGGALVAAVGVVMLITLNVHTSLIMMIVSMFLVGTGLGLSSVAYLLSVQNIVPWNLRGVATASSQFFRTIGGTVGVAVMGTILNAQMAVRFGPIFAHAPAIVARLPKDTVPANVLLTPELRALLPANLLLQLQSALAQSLFWVYALMAALSIIVFIVMFWFPGGPAELYTYKDESGKEHEMISEPVANIG